MQISHETIYVSLFVQSRGALRKELARHLRTRRQVRQPKKQLSNGQGQIVGKIMISERPAEAADRAVPGHWEGDLLVGTRTTAIGTLVERSTRYAMLFALPDGLTAERVREGLTKTVLRLPASLRRSLTWDQGPEMAEHVNFTIDTGVNVFSATREVRGSEAATKTPTDCSANTSPRATAWLGSLRTSWTE